MRGTIKKEGASWFVLYDADKDPKTGKRKQKKKRGFKTKKEAEKFLNEQLNSINNGTYFEPKDITLSEYLTYWIDNYARLNLAARTLEHYNYIITQHLKPTLGKIKISNLQPFHLQEYYTQKLETGKIEGGGLSAQSVKHHHRLISIYLTAIFTGMRRGEVLGLRWQDVDFENNVIYVRQSLQEVKKVGLTFKEPKSGKGRSITITTTLSKELKKIYKVQLEDKLLLGKEYHDLDLVFAQKKRETNSAN